MRQRKHRSVRRCACVNCLEHPFSAAAKNHRAINRVLMTLDERNRRRFVGLLAMQKGRGGIEVMVTITGMSRNTIRRGQQEVQRGDRSTRGRPAGGGRKAIEKNNRPF